MFRRRAFAVLALLAACAAPPPLAPVASPRTASSEAPPIAVAESVEPAEPRSTGPIETVDLVDDQADALVFVDVKRLRASDLWPGVQPVLHVLGSDLLVAEWTRACGHDPLAVFDHVVFSLGDRGFLIAKVEGDPDAALACFRAASKGVGADVRGVPVVRWGPGMVAVLTGSLLLAGDEQAVLSAFAKANAGDRARSGRALLDRSPGTAISAVSAALPFFSFGPTKWQLRVTETELSLDASVDASTSKRARDLESALNEMVRSNVAVGPAPDARRALAALVERLELRTVGAFLHARFAVPRDDASTRTRVVDDLSAIALGAARQERLRVATGTARALGAMLERYALSPEPKTQRPRLVFPPSAPRVPARLPVGARVDVPAAAWQTGTWKLLGFTPESPLAYSFEIVTAPNRKSTTVRAIGEPDGDGVVETVEIKVALDGSPKTVVTTTVRPGRRK